MIQTKQKILWIGGSSQLTRSYCSAYGLADENDELYLCGVEPSCPFPILSDNAHYIAQDLTRLKSNNPLPQNLQDVLNRGITAVIVSIRPVLMTSMSNEEAWQYNQKMLDGLEILLQTAIATGSVRQLIHISSVAAANHLQAQVNHSEEDDAKEAALLKDEDLAPYDRFKRHSEALVTKVCTAATTSSSEAASDLLFTNLRISGLLFEDGNCIVTKGFELQARLGVYIPSKVDMNPARNVATAIRLILSRMEKLQRERHGRQSKNNQGTTAAAADFPSMYYYTRPTLTKDPIPMSHIAIIYQKVWDLQWWECLWTPFCLYVAFIYLLYLIGLTVLGNMLPYVQATDYLLRVSLLEHSFDNTRFQRDFPEIGRLEISVAECFQNRRRYLKKSLSKDL